jgi:hypothetical protein
MADEPSGPAAWERMVRARRRPGFAPPAPAGDDDPARIARLLEKLRRAWEARPGERLGPFLAALTNHRWLRPAGLLGMDDAELEGYLDRRLGETPLPPPPPPDPWGGWPPSRPA